MLSYSFTQLRVALAIGLLGASTVGAQSTATSVRARADAEEAARNAQKAAQYYGVIDGIVTDSMLNPLTASTVSVVGIDSRLTTGANGKFRFQQVPSGQYLLVVRRVGYAPTSSIVNVGRNDTLRLTFALSRTVTALDTIRVRDQRVSMRMLDFEVRRAQGVGQFITQAQIEKRGSVQIADYLRTMRGVDVSRQTDQAFAGTIAFSRREGGGLGVGSGACAMQIVLDGIILPQFFNLDLLPSPKQIAGVEVYSGAATIPPQFGGTDRRCGLIAIWTRDGY